MVLCPAHADRNPSLAIKDEHGQVLVHCHAGCSQDAVIDQLKAKGLWESVKAWPELVAAEAPLNGNGHGQHSNGHSAVGSSGEIAATYDYRDECGQLLFQTVRYEPKDFRQRQPAPGGGWINNLRGVRLVPYRLPELLSTPKTTPVLLAEGEKDVDRLRALGFTASCNPMGAKKWRPEYSAWLKGRYCVILPDNDSSGNEHVDVVTEALLGVAASVKVVALPNLPAKGDVSDWLDAGNDRAALEALIAETPALPQPEGRYPWQNLADLVASREDRAAQLVDGIIWEGRVHWVFSDPGTGKTLFLLALLLHVAAGRPFCGRAVRQGPVLLIEEDSPLSVAAQYIDMLATIYEFDLASLPIWINKVQGLRVMDADGLAAAREAIANAPAVPVAVLFDACERIVPSDKFNTRELDPFTQLLQGLTTAHQVALVIDHTNRARGEKTKGLKPMERLFGARAKSAISDVMYFLDGDLNDGAVFVQFAKFRGEEPPGFSIDLQPDQGFRILDRPPKPRGDNERAVLDYFRQRPGQWAGTALVSQVTEIPVRTTRRILGTLATQRHLVREQEDHGDHTQYQLNPRLPGAFE